MSEDWVDIPAAPANPRAGEVSNSSSTISPRPFPISRSPADILRDGTKSRAFGAHRTHGRRHGFPAKNRKVTFRPSTFMSQGRKDYPYWHSEDWLTALHQMGAFEK